ncbi:MAG: helix-turn-helix domain-containing protein [Rubrivivax sp.]
MKHSNFRDLTSGWYARPVADEPGRVAQVRQALFEEGRVLAGVVAEPVLHSWQRCRKAGLRPASVPVFEPVGRRRINYLEGRDHGLLTAAGSLFDELQASVAHSHCKVMLTDRDGVLLRATPSCAEDSRLLRAASRPGVDLGELLVGTNAPALTARTGQACTIGAGEHFHELLSEIRCVAAPIRGRRGSVVAVLDLTVEGRPFGFNATWLVGAYASAIENSLRIAQTRQQVLLRLHPSRALLDGLAAGLVAVDEAGRIGWCNDVAAALAGIEAGDAQALHSEAVLGLGLERMLGLTAARQPQALQLPSGLTVWVQAEFRRLGAGTAEADEPPPARAGAADPDPLPEPPVAAEPAGTLAQLNRRLIEHTLALCGGNLSQAARRLGVSRGLLYRRLRTGGDGAD